LKIIKTAEINQKLKRTVGLKTVKVKIIGVKMIA